MTLEDITPDPQRGACILTFGLEGDFLDDVRASLDGLGDVVDGGDWSLARRTVDETRPSVVIVNLSREPYLSSPVPRVRLPDRELRYVACTLGHNPDTERHSLAAGYDEFVALPRDLQALRRIVRTANSVLPVAQAAMGRVIAIAGAKGGSGATLVAVNMAAELALKHEVLLMDMDFGKGDVAVALDLPKARGFGEVIQDIHHLDAEVLASAISRHESGIHVLPQPHEAGEAYVATGEEVLTALRMVRRLYPLVLADCGSHVAEHSLTSLAEADRIVLVTANDVPSVHNAWKRIRLLDRLGVEPERLRLVINRWTSNSPLSPEDIESRLGLPILSRLPSDFRTAGQAFNNGQLLRDTNPRARLTREIEALAWKVLGDQQPSPERKSWAFWR